MRYGPRRATFLGAIAIAADVTSYGQVTDRNGRDGVSFGASRTEEDEDYELVVESRYTDTLPLCGNETCPGASSNPE